MILEELLLLLLLTLDVFVTEVRGIDIISPSKLARLTSHTRLKGVA